MIKNVIKENFEDILSEVKSKDAPQRYCMFIFGIFLSTLSFNLFYSKYNIVTGGSAGLSIVFNYLYGIDESSFVFIVSMALLVLSFILLGFKVTLRNVIGTLLYPLFMKLTVYLVSYFTIESDSLFLISVYGGVTMGLASGITMKTGFTTGGFNILYQIANKYLKISIGKSSLLINSAILMLSSIVFGVPSAIYAIIALYLTTLITDRILLGISHDKTFYIITDKEEEVKEYIIDNLKHGVTLINVKGGHYNKKKKMILCVIPTKEYFNLKEVVLKIDKEAFFLITDSYEVEGAI